MPKTDFGASALAPLLDGSSAGELIQEKIAVQDSKIPARLPFRKPGRGLLLGRHVCGLVQLPAPPQRYQVRDALQRNNGEAIEICRHRAVVYEMARQRQPRRW